MLEACDFSCGGLSVKLRCWQSRVNPPCRLHLVSRILFYFFNLPLRIPCFCADTPGPAQRSAKTHSGHGQSNQRFPQHLQPPPVSYPLLEESPQCYDHCWDAAPQQRTAIHRVRWHRLSFPALSPLAHLRGDPPHLWASDGFSRVGVWLIWCHPLLVALTCHCQTAMLIQSSV